MGDGEKSRRALDETIPVKGSSTREAGSIADGLAGTHLQHFALVRLLGRGGMGAVYYGTDLSLDRPVAIKVLALDVGLDPEIADRFVLEARAQARLRHPNVAQIFFIGQDRGFHFFVMEYLEGPGLDALLAKGVPLPVTEALDYALAAARGLRAALAHGFVHRDVKPSNLMLDNESGIKILDFGLVKSMHGDAQLTRDGAIIGSPLYMSPEQGRGQVADHRSDIYSLGCSLYHMLCGRPPFNGPSPVGIITMHVTDRAPAVRDLNSKVPQAVVRIVERMMAKKPDDRFADYDELIAALESARAPRRELGGMGARGIALGIDSLLLLVATYFLHFLALPFALVYFVVCHRLLGQTPGKWLLGIRVESMTGGRITWKAALIRFAVLAWGPLAWTLLAGFVCTLHGDEHLSFQPSSLTLSQLAVPIVYIALATTILVGYLAGFLLVAFHPKRQALHDLLAKTVVYIKARAPAGEMALAVRTTTGISLSRHR
jgi:uncharacterized RDD family membrane protein YckC/tRNA A-37 threonylcarbamoyl transferase component Bud32